MNSAWILDFWSFWACFSVYFHQMSDFHSARIHPSGFAAFWLHLFDIVYIITTIQRQSPFMLFTRPYLHSLPTYWTQSEASKAITEQFSCPSLRVWFALTTGAFWANSACLTPGIGLQTKKTPISFDGRFFYLRILNFLSAECSCHCATRIRVSVNPVSCISRSNCDKTSLNFSSW